MSALSMYGRAALELWLETTITGLWLVGAVGLVLLVLRRHRPDLGTPGRVVRRVLIRARWQSVARSCGLAVTRDRSSGGLSADRALAGLGEGLDKALSGLGDGVERALSGKALDGPPRQMRTPPKPPARPETIERLPKLRHGHASPDRLTVTYRLTPARGQTVEDIADRAQALADGLGVHRVTVYRTGPNAGELVAYFGDPFAQSVAWRPEPMADALPWGTDEHGAIVALPLGQGHALFAAETGGGKSVTLNSLLASASIRPDVAILGVDLKGGVELGPWEARLSALAVEPKAAAELIAAVAEEVRRRYVRMRELGIRKMTNSDQGVGPWVLLVIDELSELLDSIEKRELVSIGRLARACGISLVGATQRPSADTLSSDLRDQLAMQRWCGRVLSPETAKMVLGSDCPLDAAAITTPGVGVLAEQGAAPRLSRAWWLDDADIDKLAAETAPLRIELDWLASKVRPAPAEGSTPRRPLRMSEGTA